MFAPKKPLGLAEFIALQATLSATVAFALDALLPALPEIAQSFVPGAPNRAQLVLGIFVLGLGCGILVMGPLSDSWGRRPLVLGGMFFYALAALAASFANSLEMLLLARFVQGLAVAAPRAVTLAIIRDLHQGREMARIASFVMMVFTLFPAVAPMIGQFVMVSFGWRAIFGAFVFLSVLVIFWFGLRQPETLAPSKRRPLDRRSLWLALREVVSHPLAQKAIAVQALCFGMIFATLSSTQQIFSITFGKVESFPYWFALIALCSAMGSFVNSRIVTRFGMRSVISAVLHFQTAFALIYTLIQLGDILPDFLRFPLHMLWTILIFMGLGFTLGNLNALAMMPMGHIAGMASSVIGSVATIGAAFFAVPIGLAFDGTPLPLAIGAVCLMATATWIMRHVER